MCHHRAKWAIVSIMQNYKMVLGRMGIVFQLATNVEHNNMQPRSNMLIIIYLVGGFKFLHVTQKSDDVPLKLHVPKDMGLLWG